MLVLASISPIIWDCEVGSCLHDLVSGTFISNTHFHSLIWAALWQNQQNGMCANHRLRSAWASAQFDQSSLSVWRKLLSLATHWVHSKDSDQTWRMPRPIWVFIGRTVILLVLSSGGSIMLHLPNNNSTPQCLPGAPHCPHFNNFKVTWFRLNRATIW